MQGPVQFAAELRGVVPAQPAGEPRELVGTGGGDGQVPGMAVDHAEGIDQLPVEVIGGAEPPGGLRGQPAGGLERVDRPDGAGRPQGRLGPAVHDLQGLDEVLHVDQRPGAVLGVHRPGADELLDLEPAEPAAAVQVERLGAVNEPVPEFFDLATQPRVARDGAELDQGLPLVAPRGAAGR